MRADDCGQHHQLELEQQEWLADPVAQAEYMEWLDKVEQQNKEIQNAMD